MSDEAPFTERGRLSPGERMSPLWTRLRVVLLEELDAKRRRNDNPLSEQDTAGLRGEIRMLKAIIGLEDDPPPTG
jgi:hypothetical protein